MKYTILKRDAKLPILEFIHDNEAQSVIPAKKNHIIPRKTDWYTYKERNLVERFINKIKLYRRIFTHFEKYARRSSRVLNYQVYEGDPDIYLAIPHPKFLSRQD